VTLLAQDITENVLSVNNVAESVTFRQVNKNNIHVHDTDSIPTVYRQCTAVSHIFTYAALCTMKIKVSNILQHIQFSMPKI